MRNQNYANKVKRCFIFLSAERITGRDNSVLRGFSWVREKTERGRLSVCRLPSGGPSQADNKAAATHWPAAQKTLISRCSEQVCMLLYVWSVLLSRLWYLDCERGHGGTLGKRQYWFFSCEGETSHKTGLKCFVAKHYGNNDPAAKPKQTRNLPLNFASSLQRHSSLSEENSLVLLPNMWWQYFLQMGSSYFLIVLIIGLGMD